MSIKNLGFNETALASLKLGIYKCKIIISIIFNSNIYFYTYDKTTSTFKMAIFETKLN